MSAGYLGMRVNGGGEVDQLERGELRRDSPNDRRLAPPARAAHGLVAAQLFAGSRMALRSIRVDRCEKGADGKVLERAAKLSRPFRP